MSYTPGPWEVRELIPDGFIIRREGTYLIWTPEYDVAANIPGGGPFRKLEDAVLAATAPDLLAALEGVRDAAKAPQNRGAMTQLQACHFLDGLLAEIEPAIAAAQLPL